MKSNTDCWSNKQLNDRIEELEDKLEAIIPIVEEITEGKGRFNMDQQIHCSNTVEDMKVLARRALGILEELS